MDQAQISKIKTQTVRNVTFLSLRNFGIQAISFLGFFLLTIILGRQEVGLFAIVAESVGILGYFSDVGLASALIQKKDPVTTDELRSTFTIQQILVIISLILVAFIYPQISQAKHFGSKELWITISLCFGFLMASLKTIPSVILERSLKFELISFVDIVENITFYVITVIFALLGFGALSYAIATFIRSLLGFVLIYRLSPWPVAFSFSLAPLKSLLRFGIPFQLNSFIAVAKDRFSSLLVAGIIGRDSYAIITWAQKGPRVPLSLMDAFMKVSFPTFSRLQDHPEILATTLKKSCYFISFFVFPILGGFCLIAPDFINMIPKYSKWLPAVIPLYFYSINAAIAAVTTPLTNVFNAVGKISVTTKFMIMWTILTWIFYPFLSWKFNYLGTSIATLLVGLSSFVVWLSVDKHFGVNVFQAIFHPLAAVSLMLAVVIWLQPSLMGTKIVIGCLVYLFYHFIFSRQELFWLYHQLVATYKHDQS